MIVVATQVLLPTLLGLPTELRLKIWEFTLCHQETAGVISPAPQKAPWSHASDSIVLKGGRRLCLKGGQFTDSSKPFWGDEKPRQKTISEQDTFADSGMHYQQRTGITSATWTACCNRQLPRSRHRYVQRRFRSSTVATKSIWRCKTSASSTFRACGG